MNRMRITSASGRSGEGRISSIGSLSRDAEEELEERLGAKASLLCFRPVTPYAEDPRNRRVLCTSKNASRRVSRPTTAHTFSNERNIGKSPYFII